MAAFRLRISAAFISFIVMAASFIGYQFVLAAPNGTACTAIGQSKSGTSAQQRRPVPVDGKIMESKLLKEVDPVYPDLALQARLEGVVRLSLSINEKGDVTDVKIIGGGYPPLQPAAAAAARQWRYSPWLDESGNAVPVTTTASVKFELPSAKSGKGQSSESRDQKLQPLRVAGKVMEARLLKRVDPVYSEQMLRARIHGVVPLMIVINERGEVTSANALRGGPLLIPAALEAVKQWRYSPYKDEAGRAIPVTTTVTVTFDIK